MNRLKRFNRVREKQNRKGHDLSTVKGYRKSKKNFLITNRSPVSPISKPNNHLSSRRSRMCVFFNGVKEHKEKLVFLSVAIDLQFSSHSFHLSNEKAYREYPIRSD